MEQNHSKPGILYSCYYSRNTEGEQFIPEHVFSYQVSGTLTVTEAGKTTVSKPGDFRFSCRNHLAKFVKQPPENGEFKSISIYLSQPALREISGELKLSADTTAASGSAMMELRSNPLYKSFVDSLLVYFQLPEEDQRQILDLKIREAVLLLLKVNPELKDILFDFSEPGKIDLEGFMQKNFRFNVSLQRFAYLTGRSQSTFKRDFEKLFHTTPSKWLLDKRLEEAHYLISKKGKSPSDVYLEVGFEDLSHFSFAFKNKYAVSPSMLRK